MRKRRFPDEKEELLKQKASRSLESERVRLLMDQPFTGAVLIRQNLIPVVDFRCPTASTDGQNIFVNPQFFLGLTPAERRFLLAHEVWHSIYLHFLRRQDREEQLFNIAADMEVNRLLIREGFKAPKGALKPPRSWDTLNAEEICEKLKKSSREITRPLPDVHLKKDRDGMQDPSAEGDPDPEEELVIDPDYQVDFGGRPEEKIREKVMEAAVQYEKLRGELPCHLVQIIEEFRNGKLPWKELLAQFVTSCYGGTRRWLPPNRRYISSGLYLQSRRESRLKAVLAIDTSGSTRNDLPEFAAELVRLLDSFGEYELKVICCDSAVCSVEIYDAAAPFDGRKIRFKGGGATSFIPVFEHLKKSSREEVQILIYFTDGYGDLPEKPPYPVLWVLTPDGKNSVPWGYEVKL